MGWEPENMQARIPNPAVPLAIAFALLIIGWAIVALLSEETRFAFVSPQAQVGVEAASALARLFGALVIGVYAFERPAGRLPWIAASFVVLGFGSLVFGYGELLFEGPSTNADEAAYEALGVWTFAGALLAAGLVPANPPRFTRRIAVGCALIVVLFGIVVDPLSSYLPDRVLLAENGSRLNEAPLPIVTEWHIVLSTVPLLLATLATAGASRAYRQGEVRGWVLIALVFFVGAQLHALYWPPALGPVLAASDILRLAFAATVVAGAAMEIGALARERARLLTREEERRRGLEELASMKADFASMVAHEFASPLFATRGYADMIASEELGEAERRRLLGKLRTETDKLEALIEDVRASASTESEGFSINLRSVHVKVLLTEAESFAKTLSGSHSIKVTGDIERYVRADPGRIGQVLRNLLKNAASYSPDGSPIFLEVSERGSLDRLSLSVSDQGPGVRPGEEERIFSKFVRGTEASETPGTGLGLYISRQIVRSHGGDLLVSKRPGGGSVFCFELESTSKQQESVQKREAQV